MKKTILYSLLIVFLLPLSAFAQGFNKGDAEINIGIGYGTPWVFREGYQTNLIPVGISFDWGVSDQLGPGVLSLGTSLVATSYTQEIDFIYWDPEFGRKANFIGLAVRSTYHYQLLEELDTYAYLHLGVGYEEWNAYGEPPPLIPLDLDPQTRFLFGLGVGAKYHFADNLFALAEVGYSSAFFKLGIGVRL